MSNDYTKEEQEELARLRQKYLALPLWDRMMGSYDYYTENQLWQAKLDDAPADCLYRYHDDKAKERGKRWCCVSDLPPDHKFRLAFEAMMERRKK